ncbi:MAG: hypothetical protein QXI39_09455 [Candidatus Bathyarchaeia archaeon]
MHEESKEIRVRLRVYRPRPEKVKKALFRRFCSKCLRFFGFSRALRRLGLDRCRGCPVFVAMKAMERGRKGSEPMPGPRPSFGYGSGRSHTRILSDLEKMMEDLDRKE